MRKIVLFLLLTSCMAGMVLAQNISKVGTTAAPFLSIGVGARALGMGGSFVSVADDATALYWNSAGIARLEANQAVFSHSEWLADISFDYAGVIMKLGATGTVGLSGTFMTMGDMERTTEAYPEGTGEFFSPSSYALGLAYAHNLTDRFSIGANFKYIHESILNSDANGFAVDIGTIYTTGFYGMNVGASITNFGTKMRISGRDVLVQHDVDPTRAGNNDKINADLQTDRFDLPLLFRVGISLDVLQGAGGQNLTISIDAVHPNDNVESVNIGGEYAFRKIFMVRGGYHALFARDSEKGMTVGGGLHFRSSHRTNLRMDYAYEDFGRLDNVQKFTFVIQF